MENLAAEVVNLITEDAYYHATTFNKLPKIAAAGLKVGGRGKGNYDWSGHTKGNLFATSDVAGGVDWADRTDINSAYGKNNSAVLLRLRDQNPKDYEEDEYGVTPYDRQTTKPVPADKLDIHTPETGWTPLAAHAPESLKKLDPTPKYVPTHLASKTKLKNMGSGALVSRLADANKSYQGQMHLFPTELYKENKEQIVNGVCNNLLEDSYYHATKLSHLPKIAATGLKKRNPDDDEKGNFHGFETHGANKLFASESPNRGVFWAQLLDMNIKQATDAPVVLRMRDQDPKAYMGDPIEHSSEDLYTHRSVVPKDKLDLYTPQTGWTPVAAHDPKLFTKLRPASTRYIPYEHVQQSDMLRNSRVPKPYKGQMHLFPLDLYKEAKNAVKKEGVKVPASMEATPKVSDYEDTPIGKKER